MGSALGSKLYYSIGEVADLTCLAPYTLRAWESEFACLRPKRVHGKNRAYRQRDIAIILLIRQLLHEERYSTKGARQKLRNEPELIRGAVEQVDRLCSPTPPSLDELSAAGRGEEAETPAQAAEAPPAPAPADAVAPPPQSEPERALLRQVRDELRSILDLLR